MIFRFRPARALIASLASLLLCASTASAVPAFARKYHTSCQTCHALFPKLNAYGEAFRLRGYRLPGETEADVKEPPVSLGAPAYKRLWPDAVWPGELPGAVPLAVNIKMGDVSTSTRNADGSVTSIRNDFQFPQEVNIFGAGTLGEHVSFWTELTIAQNPDGSASLEIEHAHIGFDSPIGPEDAVHFRIGKFAPNVVDGFHEMQLVTDAGVDSLFAYNPIGIHGGTGLGEDASGIAVPVMSTGIEAYGILRHRSLWVAGVVNGIAAPATDTTGRSDGNNAKDVYARFDYKLGGMGLDGDTGGKPLPAKNWRDNSVRLGAFVYRGDGSHIDFPAMEDEVLVANLQDQHFLRTGFYASAYWQDLNVFGAYLHGTDTLNQFDPGSGAQVAAIEPSFDAWFTQADYMVHPWLMATGRYETVTPADPSVASLRTGLASVSALVRANIKATLEYRRDLREGANHSLNVLVRFAF